MIENLLILSTIILLGLLITALNGLNHLAKSQQAMMGAVDEFLSLTAAHQQIMQDVMEEHQISIDNHRTILLSLVSLDQSDEKGEEK